MNENNIQNRNSDPKTCQFGHPRHKLYKLYVVQVPYNENIVKTNSSTMAEHWWQFTVLGSIAWQMGCERAQGAVRLQPT